MKDMETRLQKMVVIQLTVIASAICWLSASVSAQTITETSPAGITGGDTAIYDERHQGNTDTTQMLEGWPEEYKGVGISPIILEPKGTPNATGAGAPRPRAYPYLSAGGMGQVKNLSVDDELQKTGYAYFQSAPNIEQDFENDALANTRYLSLFQTMRGISSLTLSYLDKTVAAGLAQVQQQADMDATKVLLKQIAWTTAKLANPDRELLFTEADEKFQACMAGYGRLGSSTSSSGSTTTTTTAVYNEALLPAHLKHVDIADCTGNLTGTVGSTEQSAYAGIQCKQLFSPGTYHFCACCAEKSAKVSKSNVDTELVETTGTGVKQMLAYSTVERVMVGLTQPTNEEIVSNIQNRKITEPGTKIRNFAKAFRSVYGDYIRTRRNPETGVPTDVTRTKYVAPLLSLPQWVDLFRNYRSLKKIQDAANPLSCATDGSAQGSCLLHEIYDKTKYPDLQNMTRGLMYDPITQSSFAYGICPSMKMLLCCHLEQKRPSDAVYDQLWTEANYGGGITAEDLRNIIGMGYDSGEVSSGTTTSACDATTIEGLGDSQFTACDKRLDAMGGRIRRFVESYCDAAAVNAVKKFHIRMSSIALDHMTMNLKATKQERGQVQELLDRVTKTFQFAFADQSNASLNQMLEGAAVEFSRKQASEGAIASQTMAGAAAAAQRTSPITFGGPTGE